MASPGRLVALTALLVLVLAAPASGTGLEDDGGARWRLEPLVPPVLPSGQSSPTPVGLGPVGDIQFWAPNRGLLITAGSGSTIAPGLWAYDGLHWHELSDVCGATDGRIAWAGPDEFWTVSDGRPGQAADAHGNPAPLADNTLCHFQNGAVAASYASLAFQASSYQAMHGAACLTAGDCWFAGDALPEPQIGAFHLHWNGRAGALEATPYAGEAHPVEDLRAFAGKLYESVRLAASDPVFEHSAEPPPLHVINALGVSPTFQPLTGVPLYSSGEFPEALDALRLSSDAGSLWAAAGPRAETPEGSEPARVTVARYEPALGWQQLVGPESTGSDPFAGEIVRSIAAEPGTGAAWVALAGQSETTADPTARALVARVAADGTVSDEQTLPSAAESAEGIGPKGAAARVSCPAPHECWLATTQGWLFHLTASLPGQPAPGGVDGDPAFAGPITYRPPDEGLPQATSDAPPPESGLPTEPPAAPVETPPVHQEPRVTLPLVTRIRARLIHGTTLELRFRLAVRARVRLLAKRSGSTVAATRTRTFAGGERSLQLALQRRRWPTKLDLQTHALAPLPTRAVVGNSLEAPFTTGSLAVLPRALGRPGSEALG